MRKIFNRGPGSPGAPVIRAVEATASAAPGDIRAPSPSVCIAPAVFGDEASQAAVKVEAAVRAGSRVLVAGWSVGPVEVAITVGMGSPGKLRRFARPDVARHFGRPVEEEHGWTCVLETTDAEAAAIKVSHGGAARLNESLLLQDAAQLDAAQLALLGPAAGMAAFAFEPFSAAWRAAIARITTTTPAPPEVQGYLESALAIRSVGRIVLLGWALSAPGTLVWIEDEAGGIHSLDQASRILRDDLQSALGPEFGAAALNAGFIASLEGIERGTTLRLKALTPDGLHLLSEVAAAQVPAAPLPVARWLAGIPLLEGSMERSFDIVAGPILAELIRRDRAEWDELPVSDHVLGNLPIAPAVSIIVPLYARTDFVESQMVEWARDHWIRENAEIIYVIDDPELVAPFRQQADELHRLYGVPFRWLWGHINRGFSGANNLGAAHARAPKLLFLNSDAFPQQPGWLARMTEALDGNPEIGVVGARLTFAEGGIQHAGMRFEWLEQYGVWLNKHPGMGLDPALDPASGPTRVPAVTGACMLLRADDFKAVGGWDTGYLIGDFEDSDLCLKLHERGLGSLYLPDVQLTHLERQSMNALGSDAFRIWVTLWNAVRHQRRWRPLIERFAEAAQ